MTLYGGDDSEEIIGELPGEDHSSAPNVTPSVAFDGTVKDPDAAFEAFKAMLEAGPER
jgi:hypothetical protein